MTTRSRRFVFTLNNYTEEEEFTLVHLVGAEGGIISYILFGKEEGDSGTPHLQGYLETASKIGFARLKELMKTPRVHLEKARGSLASNQRYCKKEGRGIFKEGSPMQQVILLQMAGELFDFYE